MKINENVLQGALDKIKDASPNEGQITVTFNSDEAEAIKTAAQLLGLLLHATSDDN